MSTAASPAVAARRRALAVTAVSGVLFLSRLLLAIPFAVPLQVDELGYLGNARYLANGSGLVATAGRAPYKIGYPLLLAPAARAFAGLPGPMLRSAQVVNAILAALIVPLAVWLAGRLRPDLGFADRLAAASCAALYPAISMYATTAMAFTVLAAGYTGYLCLAWAATDGIDRSLPWLAWGGLTGLLYSVHERALPWLGVALAVALVAALAARRTQPLMLLPAAALAAALPQAVRVPGGTYQTGSTAVETLVTALRAPRTLVATAAGQPWYLWLASGGLLVIGGWAALATRRDADRLRGKAGFWLVVVGSAGATLAMSVLHMAHRHQPRFTHWIYGRYNESLCAGLILICLLALAIAGPDRRARVVWRGTAVALALLVTATIVLRTLWTPRIGNPFGFNVGATCLYDLLTSWGLLRAAGCGAALAIALALAYRRSWRLGVVTTAVFFVATTAAATAGYWLPASRQRVRERELVTRLGAIAPADRLLLYERRDWPNFFYYNASFLLPDWRIELCEPRRGECSKGELLVSSRRDVGALAPGARLAGLEWLPLDHPPFIQGLWVRPGALADTLAARGWLLPAAFPCRLESAALAAELTITGLAVNHHMASGAGAAIEIGLRHRGTTPWPDRHGWKRRAHTVVVVLRWQRAADGSEAARDLLELPRMLYPGEDVRLATVLEASDDAGAPLVPGRYDLAASVAQRDAELVPVDGPTTVVVPVTVTTALE